MPSTPRAGLVVGKFWPPHRGHQLLLETAAAQVTELLVLVYANPDSPTHPAAERAQWLRELYRGDEAAEGPGIGPTPLRIYALAAADGVPPDAADDYTQREFVRQWLARQGLRADVVFSSEDYGPGFAGHLGVPHVAVDNARAQVPISGTLIRAAAREVAGYLHPLVAAQLGVVPPAPVPRVVFLGAESSGKSTLCAALADACHTVWVPEYGRTLHEQKHGNLEFEDLLYIARRHAELEDEAATQAQGVLFCDTNAATTALYSYYYFHRCDPILRAMAAVCGQRYAHTFVCAPTVPFEQDGWRGPEALRSFQHGMILMQLDFFGIPYTLVEGTVAERVAQVREVLGTA
ncbi:multifunctional transcriptional regulator/nicotinamide-nucleotide adenylyltransferase/ribosylnicotinamide kinase NadR [Hymenobacter glaciei]|uniref:Multifunctional transcriptional regulator/nicotinamide-nucleotide adenylyltransferase/ribosylnicotinamide kinase NadR n=1 Tax=Hymenobacter glaciei TaxID=877209 RepID=A0ABP7UEA0_9BACT